MSKYNTMPALSAKQKTPEHHRVKPAPFHRAFQELHGHSYCTRCGAINFKKRWYFDPVQEQILRLDKNVDAVVCPGCRRVESGEYEGEVILANSKCATQMGEIVALIKHTEGKCWHSNHTAKIAAVNEVDDVIHIETTTSFLAERIGKELRKAFKGNLELKRTPEEKFMRAYWSD